MGTELSGGAPLKSCVQWRGGGGVTGVWANMSRLPNRKNEKR